MANGYDDFSDYLSSQFYGGNETPQSPPPYIPQPTSDRSIQIITPGGEKPVTPGGGTGLIHPVQTAQAEQPDTGGGGGESGGGGGGGTPAASGIPNMPAPGNNENAVYGMYSKWLGRGASAAEVQQWLASGLDLSSIENQIANSPEAASFAKAQPGTGGSGGGGNGGGSGNGGYADPAYQRLLDLVNGRLSQLQSPVSFPQMDQLMAMLTAQQGQAKQRAQTFADQLGSRVGELQKPLMTDANVVQQRALASNSLLGQRDNALANSREAIAARGFDPRTSGIALNQENIIGKNYGDAQGQIDARLQQSNIATDESRRNLATNLQGLAQQALQGGDLTALQEQSQNAQLENQLFNLNENRANQTLAVGQIPVDLTNQGFRNALAASSSQQNPLSMLLSLASLGNTQQGIQQSGQNSNMSSLAWLMQSLFK